MGGVRRVLARGILAVVFLAPIVANEPVGAQDRDADLARACGYLSKADQARFGCPLPGATTSVAPDPDAPASEADQPRVDTETAEQNTSEHGGDPGTTEPIIAGSTSSAAVGSGPTVHLVVDTSGSMSGTPLAQAKTALHEVINGLGSGNAGLRSYDGSCGYGGVLRVPIEPVNKAALHSAVDGLVAGGGTPTPDALAAAAADLPSSGPRTIILVSDGQSSCGDPCPVAQQLGANLGIEFRVHAVGFNPTGNAPAELSCIAAATGGQYFEATDAPSLSKVIQTITRSSYDTYMALGDSYSSGEGTYRYDGWTAAGCHRGPLAWPRVLEANSDSIGPITHRACSGATTAAFTQRFKMESAQIQPNADIDLVTFTMGGNDLGFGGILTGCVAANCSGTHESPGFGQKLQTLKSYLTSTVYPDLRAAYPSARIIHVGYPRITPAPGQTPVRCGWLDSAEVVTGDQLVRRMNTAISEAADQSPHVEYLDIYTALHGHELCTADSWMEAINVVNKAGSMAGGIVWRALGRLGGNLVANWIDNTEQGHPTPRGQRAIAEMVAQKIGVEY